MKKRKRLWTVICVIFLLCGILSGCRWLWNYEIEPTEEIIIPVETEATEPAEKGPSALMEGYVNTDVLNIRSGPGSNYDLLGQYKKDDFVRIYEIDGQWGKTEIGWIHLGYVNITQEYPEQTDSTIPGSDQEETADEASGNINSALLGKWYSYSEPAPGGMYFIFVHEFKSNGIFEEPCYCYTEEDIKEWNNVDENNFMQSYSHPYEVHGNQILYRFEDDSDYIAMTFSVSGNVLKLNDDTFYRGNLIDALNEIKKSLNGEQDPTEGEQEWPALDPNAPIIGSWYRYKTTGEYCVYTMDFLNNGSCGDGAWVFQNNDPNNKAEQVSGAWYEYTVSGGKVLYKGFFGNYSEESYSVSGDCLILGGVTYYRGTYQEGLEKLRAELLENNQPTEPPTEVPTEVPIEIPTEVSIEEPT